MAFEGSIAGAGAIKGEGATGLTGETIPESNTEPDGRMMGDVLTSVEGKPS